jgi:hypothetical protein
MPPSRRTGSSIPRPRVQNRARLASGDSAGGGLWPTAEMAVARVGGRLLGYFRKPESTADLRPTPQPDSDGVQHRSRIVSAGRRDYAVPVIPEYIDPATMLQRIPYHCRPPGPWPVCARRSGHHPPRRGGHLRNSNAPGPRQIHQGNSPTVPSAEATEAASRPVWAEGYGVELSPTKPKGCDEAFPAPPFRISSGVSFTATVIELSWSVSPPTK